MFIIKFKKTVIVAVKFGFGAFYVFSSIEKIYILGFLYKLQHVEFISFSLLA